MWEIENIPDDAILFRRVPSPLIIDGEVGPGAFQNHPGTESISSNWSHYADADETRNQVVIFGKNPKEYGVVKMLVSDIKQKKTVQQAVDHAPDEPNGNRAHAHVTGRKRKKLKRSLLPLRLFAFILKYKVPR